MMKRVTVLAILLALFTSAFAVMAQDEYPVGPITQRIIDRGELICGVNQSLTGFGVVNDAGEFEGFDVDLCRAVAAAVLGDSEAVVYRPLIAADRQAAIQSGEIDLMVRNTTWTLSRDVTWNAIFGPTTFYDGQGIGTRIEYGFETGADLDGASICVQAGTTTELNITDFVNNNMLDTEIQVYPDANSTWEAFVSARCEAWTTDKSGIISFHATSENPAELTLLPDTLSKEPLGPLSPQEDPQFAEIVEWTVYALIQAEEYGITSENVMDFLDSEDAGVQRLLGAAGQTSGAYLGIANDFVVAVISQVGNYGEIYDRHLTPLGVNRAGSLNDLWSRGGLLYAMPFR